MRLVPLALAICAAVFAPLSALAAPRDAVMNKEGFWAIDVDNGACAASMMLQGGAIFLLRAQDGKVTFALFRDSRPLPRGKAGRVETEAYGFDFKPDYGDDATTLFYDGDLDARALAALRLARQARILIDGKPVTSMTLEGTGFEGALDGAIACSNGEKGWWGEGVAAAEDAGPTLVYEREGSVWGIVTDGASCLAQAAGPDNRFLQLLSVGGRFGLAVGSQSEPLPRGRRARAETDSYKFEFEAEYGEDTTYMNSADLLSSADAFALRRAEALRITVGGRELIDVSFEEGSFQAIVDAVTACSRGEKGWWGEGAKPVS